MKKTIPVALMLALLSACVDSSYDLEDIDTTVRVDVTGLTLPINIDSIALEHVILLSGQDAVQVVDGEYAIVRRGTVNSDPILIKKVLAKAPVIASTLTPLTASSSAPRKASGRALAFQLSSEPSPCVYKASGVSSSIASFSSCLCDASIDITMSIPQAQSLIKGADFYNLVFQLPKGLTLSQNAGGIYNAATGELVIAHLRTTGNSARLHLGIAAVNMNQASATYDRDASTVTVAEQVYLKSGSVTIADADVLSTLPSSMKLRLDYNLSDIDITAFSGEINYQIEGATVPAVNLSSLPDIFSKSGTDIVLRNPRIYLNLSNPLQGYGLTERSGMTLTPMRGNVTGTPCSLDAATPYIVIGTDQPGAEYQYCLSPEPVATPDSEFPSAAHVGFKSLSALLSGDGLPSSVNIDLTNPCVPQQTVANLPLGINLGAVGGTYKYVAPFEFAEGSQIVYTRTLSGWNGEDVDQITITALEVSADVTTNMPLRLTLTGFPIDVDGNQINDVEIVGADLDANASSQHVTLKITGEVRHLDGLKFKAVATAGETTATLAPSMTIDLKNIRPVATGYYIKKL